MSVEKVVQVSGTGVYVPGSDIDTDRIIPARFMKCVTFDGLGEYLFHDVRKSEDGSEKEHPLNDSRFNGANILLTGVNFGCGSSREHAVWAVAQQGFRVVIAPTVGEIPGFADIFRNNCAKNGVLAIELGSAEVDSIFEMTAGDEPLEASVDLEGQKVSFKDAEFTFEIESAVKEKLLQGLDDIAESLLSEADITEFEKTHNAQLLPA